jgi:hypothetical protein
LIQSTKEREVSIKSVRREILKTRWLLERKQRELADLLEKQGVNFEVLGISTRDQNALIAAGITSLTGLIGKDLRMITGIGRTGADAIKEGLRSMGF